MRSHGLWGLLLPLIPEQSSPPSRLHTNKQALDKVTDAASSAFVSDLEIVSWSMMDFSAQLALSLADCSDKLMFSFSCLLQWTLTRARSWVYIYRSCIRLELIDVKRVQRWNNLTEMLKDKWCSLYTLTDIDVWS